jgi:hypothetical protein
MSWHLALGSIYLRWVSHLCIGIHDICLEIHVHALESMTLHWDPCICEVVMLVVSTWTTHVSLLEFDGGCYITLDHFLGERLDLLTCMCGS